jgi:plastocyanin
MKRVLVICAVTGMLVTMAGVARAGGGCHSTGTTQETVASVRKVVEVNYAELCVRPTVLHVQPGQTVTWRNTDPIEHTITSGSGWWADQTLAEGETFSHTFSEPGLYPFYCMIHPNMGGVIDVAGATPVAATAQLPVKAAEASSGAGLAGASGVAGLLGGAVLGIVFMRKRNGSSREQT